MKTVKLELIQGDNNPLVFTRTIDTDVITEVSGTIVQNVLNLYAKTKKFKMNIGFSFARKFDVKVTIDGVESSFNKVIASESVKFGITLGEKSVERFAEFIHEFVTDCMTQQSDMVVDLEEIRLN